MWLISIPRALSKRSLLVSNGPQANLQHVFWRIDLTIKFLIGQEDSSGSISVPLLVWGQYLGFGNNLKFRGRLP